MTDVPAIPSEMPAGTPCPSCESLNVRVEQREDRFLYGVDEQATELSALVPMSICSDCGLQYTDEVGEQRRQEAICRHLGILSPAEIVALREKTGKSRRQFAAISHIGLASLSRWESGQGTQNKAMDIYLRLLCRKDVFEIVERSDFEQPSQAPLPRADRFPSISKMHSPSQVTRLASQANVFRIDRARATG